MYVHMFLFRWRPDATPAVQDDAVRAIRAFQGVVPGLREVSVGHNLSPNGGGYGLGGVMRFVDADAYAAYVSHPAHQALLVWLVPVIDAIECDFDA